MGTQTRIVVTLPLRATEELSALAWEHRCRLLQSESTVLSPAPGATRLSISEFGAAMSFLGGVWRSSPEMISGTAEPLCDFNNADDGVLSWSAGVRDGSINHLLEALRPFLRDALRAAGHSGSPSAPPRPSDMGPRALVLMQEEYGPLVMVEIGPESERRIDATGASWVRT